MSDTPQLTPEQAKELMEAGMLTISITSTSGKLMPTRAYARMLNASTALIRAVATEIAKEQGRSLRGKDALRVDIKEIECFPAANGGMKIETTLFIHPASDKLGIRWETDAEMLAHVERWKARRDGEVERAAAASGRAEEQK